MNPTNGKKKIALMSYAMDNRQAKGQALYTRKLITGLLENRKEEYYLVHYDKVKDPLYQKGYEILMPKIRLPFGSRFFSQLLFFWKYRKQPFDLIHWFQPRLYPFYWLAPAKKIIVTVHGAGDITALAPFVFSRSVFNFVLKYFHYWIDNIIVVSQNAKSEVMKHYGFPADKVKVIYLGGGELKPISKNNAQEVIFKKYSISGPYILDISRLQPHKNIVRLIEAYTKMRTNDLLRKEKLVIVGGQMYKARREYEAAEKSPFAKDIIFIEFVPAEDLNLMYSASDLFVFPSLDEGFGLPVLEAMESGTSVITSNLASMPEIGGEAVFLVDPFSVEEISRAMQEVLGDSNLRQKMIESGLHRAKEFSWQKMVEQTEKLYE